MIDLQKIKLIENKIGKGRGSFSRSNLSFQLTPTHDSIWQLYQKLINLVKEAKPIGFFKYLPTILGILFFLEYLICFQSINTVEKAKRSAVVRQIDFWLKKQKKVIDIKTGIHFLDF